jgi:HlyD family secretion protein
LPAGGKVFTMLDISYVYMDIYLPTLSGLFNALDLRP